MRIKRKTPILTDVLQRMLQLRFPEMEELNQISPEQFEIKIHQTACFAETVQQLDCSLGHYLNEFGEQGTNYEFHVTQGTLLEATLCYQEDKIIYRVI